MTNAFNQPIYVGDTSLVNQPGESEGASRKLQQYPAGSGCLCVNWYCRNNPRAYDF